MTAENGRYTVNSRDIVSEVIEGEVIAIDLAGGAYYSLRGSAAEAWAAPRGGSGGSRMQWSPSSAGAATARR